MSLPIAVGTTVLADRFILFLYSSEFANAVLPLRILIWALVFMFFNALLSFILYSADRQNFLALTTGGMLALNVLLNLWLIPRHSYLAASYTTVLTEAVGFSVNFLFVTRNIVRVSIAAPMLKAVAGSLLMAGVLLPVRDISLGLLVASGAGVYFAFLFLSGAIDSEDRRVLADTLSGRA